MKGVDVFAKSKFLEMFAETKDEVIAFEAPL